MRGSRLYEKGKTSVGRNSFLLTYGIEEMLPVIELREQQRSLKVGIVASGTIPVQPSDDVRRFVNFLGKCLLQRAILL